MPRYVFRVKRGLTTCFRLLALVLGTLVGTVMLHTVVVAGLWLVSTAASDCQHSKDHDVRIDGCSAMIQRNPKDVVAHHNRGEAYSLKGDIDRVISDYTKAIELNPNYAPTYHSRGRAYTSKGDYIRAVADVTKAGELIR